MEAKLERPSHGQEDGGTHSVVVGEDEGEKKSVLKKVKDKAKKMKDTLIKNHGHGHPHHDRQNDDDEQDKDPEAHGAPMYESSVVRESNTNLEKPKDDRLVTDSEGSAPENKNPPPVRLVEEEDPHCPNNTPASANIPHSTPTGGNYQAQVCPLVPKFETLNVHDAPISQEQNQDCSDTISSATCGVADKAISTKNVVASKLGYTGGANTVKEYLSEKFKPGDEDKALSKAITDALHKGEEPRRGKVTVSKEVADRLGLGTDRESKREGEDAVVAGEESSGDTLAERLQNALSSWLSKSTGIQTAQDSLANAFVNNAGSGSGGPTSGSRKEPCDR